MFARIRDESDRAVAGALRSRYTDRPLPMGLIKALGGIVDRERLFSSGPPSTGAALTNRFLASHLKDEELGGWKLGAETLDRIERAIQRRRPRTILELGSGVSTLCFSRYMTELHGDGGPFVFSIEQDPGFADATQKRLEEAGLAGAARVVARPIVPVSALGQRATCYDLGEGFLDEFLQGRRPDMLVIDGPAGPEGARLATLPLLLDRLGPDATVFLDDALRTSELQTISSWRRLIGVSPVGIWPLDKGLFEARVL